jgi:hypothetical protein
MNCLSGGDFCRAAMQARVRSETALACRACESVYDERAWQELALVERIEPDAVRRFVSIWPAGVCVEVRRCSRCGKSIAAKR